MKILIYSSSSFSDNTLPLYKTMKEKGIDVTLLYELSSPKVTLFNEGKLKNEVGIFKASEYSSFKKFEQYCDISNVYVENTPGIDYRNVKILRSTWQVYRFIKENRFDVIHIDRPMMLWKAPLLVFRKKMVLIMHEAIPHAQKLHPIVAIFRKLNYRLISKIVILNHAVHEEFCMKYKIEPERVLVNKLGPLDCIKIFAPKSSNYDCTKLVFWGRIARYKGVEYLCQAMTIVHEHLPEAKLVIAGGGDFYFDIKPYQDLPYIKIVHKYLEMEELAKIISDAAFTVCPYVSSSQSGGVITSLVMGKPVIGTDYETMHEMIEDGVTGILVPPRDVNALAGAIIHLLKDTSLQRQLMDNIRKNNATNTEWSQIVDKYMDFYQKDL